MAIAIPVGFADQDLLFVFRALQSPHLNISKKSLILEVGSNEEDAGDILMDNGYRILGVDFRPRNPTRYFHVVGDFVAMAMNGSLQENHFDVIFSTSAIEHFGLGVYTETFKHSDYDCMAMDGMYRLLKPGGLCVITVPYGKNYLVESDWRIYNNDSIGDRIIRRFQLVHKEFFLSASAPGFIGESGPVSQEQADAYDYLPPHVTIGLVMRKPSA